MKLSDLQKGENARIIACAQDIPLKLVELGCLKGREITLLYTSPWGTPLYYRIGNDYIALDRSLTRKIEIRKIDEQETKVATHR